MWFMNGAAISSATRLGASGLTTVGARARPARSGCGSYGFSLIGGGSPGSVASTWSIVATGDFNGDGFSDFFWRDTSVPRSG
jgi:hypothetical protein